MAPPLSGEQNPVAGMASIKRDLLFIIRQLFDDLKYKDTIHELERESAFFFDTAYFEDCLMNGRWEVAERYLQGFTDVEEKVFFEIRRQKFLEALDDGDRTKAADILCKELKLVSSSNKAVFKECVNFIPVENFRDIKQLSKYPNAISMRPDLCSLVKEMIEKNPVICDKIKFPTIENKRLLTIINQSLSSQHGRCNSPPNAEVNSLLYDHSCSTPNDVCPPSSLTPFKNHAQNKVGLPKVEADSSIQHLSAPKSLSSVPNVSHMSHPAFVEASVGLSARPSTAARLKHSMTPPTSNSANYHSAYQEQVLKRPRLMGTSAEVILPTTHLPVGYTGTHQNQHLPDELPKTIAATLYQGSSVMSMDFHPSKPTVLLVGVKSGDITLWNVPSTEMLSHEYFKIWYFHALSLPFQAAIIKDPTISVNRVVWNHDGSQFGVAYSKHLVHLYTYKGGGSLTPHLEIDAHVGGVSDIAFFHCNEQLFVISCGDDKTVKVWDAITGVVRSIFVGHETPVYSVCPQSRGGDHFIFSISCHGEIKAWIFGIRNSVANLTAPGHGSTTMAYSADQTRLFSCGTSVQGDTYIAEWSEREGSVMQRYTGFKKGQSLGVVQFDVAKNRFLAAGDEFLVKFWDMDNRNLLATTDVGGGLAASSRVRFNKTGSLLAVSTNDNCIKILANADGLRLVHFIDRQLPNATRPASLAATNASTFIPLGPVLALPATNVAIAELGATMTSNGGSHNVETQGLIDVDARIIESTGKSKTLDLTEISEPSQIHSHRLSTPFLAKVARLTYSHSGCAILALAYDGAHKLWRWKNDDGKTAGQETAFVAPEVWIPPNGLSMINEMRPSNPEDSSIPGHCFALANNDAYLLSASGWKVSLFHVMSFETMSTFMTPPPACTAIAFHTRDNNLLVVGMDDGSIQFHNCRRKMSGTKIKGYQCRVTGLAFSDSLNILLSSGADTQICTWEIVGSSQICTWENGRWAKKASKHLCGPRVRGSSPPQRDTHVQFHNDEVHFLVVQESQLDVYIAPKLECINQWVPLDGFISSATYSCDCRMIYASFASGSIGIFTPALQLMLWINCSAYLNAESSPSIYPLVVAANPVAPNQFALGLTDGSIHVIEPSNPEAGWGAPPSSESVTRANAARDSCSTSSAKQDR